MIIYLVKSTLLLGLLFGLYKLLLENEKMHRFNRFFLLFALVFGLTAPLISFEFQPEQSIAGIQMQQVERVVNAPAKAVDRSIQPLITPEQGLSPGSESTPDTVNKSNWSIGTLNVILALYGAITLFLLIRFVAGLIQIRNKVKAGTRKELEHATLVLLEEPITPQSFLDYIFLEKQPFESGNIEPEILDHEFTHVRQLHSFDVLLIEFLKVIFWFNPLMYLYKHAIQLNHEFLADEAVVRSGSSISDYQELLIRVSSGNNSLKTTSSINFSLTKKRLRMMGTKISKIKVGAVWLFVLPLSVALIIVFSAQTDKYPQTMSMQEIWDSMPPTTYYDVELESDGPTGLYHPLDERTGVLIGPNGEPYTGERNTYRVETDSLIQKETIVNGKITQTEFHMYDSTGSYQYRSVVIPSLDEDGNTVSTYYDDRLTDSLVLNMEKIDTDSLITTKAWHPNGQLAWEFQMKMPGGGRHGMTTVYDENGDIVEQERYENGELIEKIK
ncbi:M56 family metallopeptidase [Gracilimonas amylolytica]|uniref:M56 family metallopeptidase n=1 Tax=Gracilimonas amylolytica TaxID=1749045 RepID=UPI000CD9878D|nr:M56 family metallopeptidase [Gracilimonas amylolytica]